jgi:hypothetical protein
MLRWRSVCATARTADASETNTLTT